MKIKHFKGRFNNRLYIDLMLWLAIGILRLLLWLKMKKKSYLVSEYDESFIYHHGNNNQLDWRKIIGTKSGTNTETNYEEIVVNRFIPPKNDNGYLLGTVETALYIRKPHLDPFVLHKESSLLFKGMKVVHKTPVEFKYALPVTPWAGGNEMNQNDYSYWIKFWSLFGL